MAVSGLNVNITVVYLQFILPIKFIINDSNTWAHHGSQVATVFYMSIVACRHGEYYLQKDAGSDGFYSKQLKLTAMASKNCAFTFQNVCHIKIILITEHHGIWWKEVLKSLWSAPWQPSGNGILHVDCGMSSRRILFAEGRWQRWILFKATQINCNG